MNSGNGAGEKRETAIEAPLRLVRKALLRGGGAIFAAFKYHWWELHLECGHVVERRIKWLKISNPPRGWQAQHKGVSLERLPSAPKKARCEVCASCLSGRPPKGPA